MTSPRSVRWSIIFLTLKVSWMPRMMFSKSKNTAVPPNSLLESCES